MKIKRKIFLTLGMLLLMGSIPRAQGADFDPANPPEPNEIIKSNVTVTASPEEKGYTSGTGRYLEGTKVTISTSSAEANWKFKRWLKDGEEDTSHTTSSFSYTVGRENVTFTAVYEYVAPVDPVDPDDPDEPDEPVVPEFNPENPAEPEYIAPVVPEDPVEPPVIVVEPKYALNLVNNPRNAGSFNIDSGNEYTEGTILTLKATGNQDFEFLGWYDENGYLLSSSLSFTYKTSAQEATLTARWYYNPGSPDEPAGSQDDIDNSIEGDVNADEIVNAADIQRILNIISKKFIPGTGDHSGDVNKDGYTNAADIQRVLNIIAGK